MACNVFARTAVGLDSDGLAALRAIEAGEPAEASNVWEIERFGNAEGLFADPTPFIRSSWGEPERLEGDELVERLRDHCVLIDDEEGYRARFAPKTSLLDARHFGNLHEQLGQELLLRQRIDPEEWWLGQKFAPGLQRLGENLYRAVQGRFLERYVPERFGPGDVVVDLGCGTGIFSSLIARQGADVLGVDPNARYVEIARANAASGASFEVAAVGSPAALDFVPSASADFVFMSDALLFYFVPLDAHHPARIEQLLSDIRRILKPGGRFISMEPHPVFWLALRLGDADRPFTVLNEYATRMFAVTPTPSIFIQTLARHGFSVMWMEELGPPPDESGLDERALAFHREFPLYQLYEFATA